MDLLVGLELLAHSKRHPAPRMCARERSALRFVGRRDVFAEEVRLGERKTAHVTLVHFSRVVEHLVSAKMGRGPELPAAPITRAGKRLVFGVLVRPHVGGQVRRAEIALPALGAHMRSFAGMRPLVLGQTRRLGVRLLAPRPRADEALLCP